jgi:hypothetical protein
METDGRAGPQGRNATSHLFDHVKASGRFPIETRALTNHWLAGRVRPRWTPEAKGGLR